MAKLELQYSDGTAKTFEVLNAVNQIISSDKKIIVLEGGSGAGKTWIIITVMVILAMSQASQRFMMLRERLTWFRSTTLEEFEKCLRWFGLWDEKAHNKSRFRYILNGCKMDYTGLDEGAKLLGTDWDYCWINEALDDGITSKDVYQLVVRTLKKVFIDYNPKKLDSHIYDDIIPREDCLWIQSSIFDNPFAPESRKQELLRTKDPILRLIYLDGKRAQPKGLIYPDVTIVKDYPLDPKREILGMDFGYENAPSAIVKVCFNDGEIWIEELGYEYGLNIIDGELQGRSIETILNENSISFTDEIIADKSSSGAILSLQAKGWNIKKDIRYPGSVNDGIDAVKRYKINITESSLNIIKERLQYRWKEINGKLINEPFKDSDHAFDAVRYAVFFRDYMKVMSTAGGGSVSVVKMR